MRKWCPEPLNLDHDDVKASSEFRSETGRSAPEVDDPGFEKDDTLGRRETLWDMMSPSEQEQVLAMARKTLGEEFRVIRESLVASHEENLQEIRAEFDARFDLWTRAFSEEWQLELKTQAAEAASLALTMARKIIRDTVEVDPGFVIRTLETALFKVKDNHRLTVTVHPEDAVFLDADPDLKSRLRIEQVIADRRVARGGCHVRAGVREWDATLAGQLETMSGLVEEISAADATGPAPRGDADDDLLA